MTLILTLWFTLVLSVFAGEHFIVLAHGSEMQVMQEKEKYEKVNRAYVPSTATLSMHKIKRTFTLDLGPFEANDVMAVVYMHLKETFPSAVIIEKEEHRLLSPSPSKTMETKVYVDKEVIVEKEDTALWTALFALALVGILFMFLSSEQIKRLKAEHKRMKSQHKKLEEKQHEVLASMGESIHTLAKESMTHTSKVVEQAKDVADSEDIEKMKLNEYELLDVTGDLIRFLRLKSKKVHIQNEVFNINHVLNEVAGNLHNTYKNNDTELIFDIDKEVPKSMLADSLHLGQILTNLLEYVMQNTQSKEVKLEVTTEHSLTEGLALSCRIESDIVIGNQESLFESYYDETLRRYVGLGLFVAKELTQLMGGELLVVDTKEGSNALVVNIPIEEKNKEKRKYRLPDKGLVGKKILIVDTSSKAAAATEKLFAYFRAEVTVLTAEKFGENMPNIARYDIVALNDGLFSRKMIEVCKTVKASQDLKVISLENLFSSHEPFVSELVDCKLKKPLTQEYVFDTLIELYTPKKEKESKEEAEDTLLVYKRSFKHTENVGLESFSAFKGKEILIVEDNVINQKVLLSILGKSGMQLHVANNGEEALNMMQKGNLNIDFIFMDINMPVMDGYVATENLRKDARFDAIPIVALTALVSAHEIDKMYDMGMNGYLPKPLHIEKLYTALDMFLGTQEESLDTEKSTAKPHMNLEGLNIEEGLRRMKENDVFYREVLSEFMDAYEQSDEVFETLVQEQRFEQLNMLCLDMKGLTGTIGATEMHDLIHNIHQQLIYNKHEELKKYLASFSSTFTTLKKSIENYLKS